MFKDRTIGLMHTTSSYPCPPEELNLNMIKTLSNEFPNHIIGYPDMKLDSQQPLLQLRLVQKLLRDILRLIELCGEQINLLL